MRLQTTALMRTFAIELERVGEFVIDSLDYLVCPHESVEYLHGLGLCAVAFWRTDHPQAFIATERCLRTRRRWSG